MAADPELPLAGLRVLGVTRVVAGPYLEQLLGDMGAEVIRIEPPGHGDDARHIPPFKDGISLTYLIVNRNKKSITLNLRSAEGVALFKRLAAQADVVVESNRPGVMERLGLGYETLREVNPRLVMTSISGFGQSGPYAQQAGYNQIAQAESGFMALTGFADGPPVRTAAMIGDYLASLYAAFGTLVALRQRERTGEGQWVDASLFESMVAVLGTALQEYLSLGRVRQRTGNWAPTMAPSNVYRAEDGEIMVVAGNDLQWRRLCTLMGRPELTFDARFATAAARIERVEATDALVAAWTAERSVDSCAAALKEAGIPCAIVNGIDRVAEHPQLRARRLIETVAHLELGPLPLLGVLPKLSRSPGRIASPPPALGEHNREILCGLLGMSEAELERLAAVGVV